MKTEALHTLRSYWEDLRKGRVAPYRAELDPRRFEDLLENMFILEQVGPGQVRVRLAGLALCRIMGMEVRGMPPEAMISAGDRAAFARHLDAVLSAPAVVELDLSAADMGDSRMPGHMLLLPLRSDFGEITRVLGCVITGKGNLRTPVNFNIEAHRVTVIRPAREHETAPLPGFSEMPAAYAPAALRAVVDNPHPAATEPRRGHLKVVSAK